MNCSGPVRIKICGITSIEDAEAACEAGADALGFNFAAEARMRARYIEPDAAQRIVEQLPPFVSSVAVCVNDPVERVLEYLSFTDRVQLHGEESADNFSAISHRVIKAFRVGGEFSFDNVYAWHAGAILLDAWVADARGGTGRTCDWDTARAVVDLGRPVILAGGLTPDNVSEAVRRVRPYGVDTAGGVESAPGKKDHAKLRDFVARAREALSVSG